MQPTSEDIFSALSSICFCLCPPSKRNAYHIQKGSRRKTLDLRQSVGCILLVRRQYVTWIYSHQQTYQTGVISTSLLLRSL